jgi:hypothetical protein
LKKIIKPADLLVVQPTNFALRVNLKAIATVMSRLLAPGGEVRACPLLCRESGLKSELLQGRPIRHS